MRFPKITLVIIILSGFFLGLRGQNQEIGPDFDRLVNHAPLIVEGKIITSTPFRHDRSIMTEQVLLVSRVLKGVLDTNRIGVVTCGGQIGEMIVACTHNPFFSDQAGLYFLSPDYQDVRATGLYSSTMMMEVGGDMGALYPSPNDPDQFRIRNQDGAYGLIRKELVYARIEALTGLAPFNPGPTAAPDEKGILYTLQDFFFSEDQLDFDIYINSLTSDFYLAESSIRVKYNEFLGQFLANTEGIEITIENNQLAAHYELELIDEEANSLLVRLTLETPTTEAAIFLDEEQQWLIHVSVDIDNPTIIPEVLFSAEVATNKFLAVGDNDFYPVDFVQVTEDWSVLSTATPSITDISPMNTPAGTGEIITISGQGFGSVFIPGLSQVLFRNANAPNDPESWVRPFSNEYYCNLTSNVVCWSDDEIQIKVPTVGAVSTGSGSIPFDFTAGSGKIQVCSFGSCTASTDELIVPFAVRNFNTNGSQNPPNNSMKVVLANLNQSGGYSIRYDGSFANSPQSIANFESALDTWRCQTGINFITNQSYSSEPGSIEVRYVNNLSNGVRGRTQYFFQLCEQSGELVAYVKNMIIEFDGTASWNTNFGSVADCNYLCWDLESVALHELGHACLQAHTRNPDDLMYGEGAIMLGEEQQWLSSSDLDGASYVLGLSTTNYGCYPPMQSYNCSGVNSSREQGEPEVQVIVTPNPARHSVSISIPNGSVSPSSFRITDNQGRTILEEMLPQNATGWNVDVSSWAPGLYNLMIITSSSQTLTRRLIKI